MLAAGEGLLLVLDLPEVERDAAGGVEAAEGVALTVFRDGCGGGGEQDVVALGWVKCAAERLLDLFVEELGDGPTEIFGC